MLYNELKTKEMKTLYKSLMAFAASLLLVPASMAQTTTPTPPRPYLLSGTSGFGFDKYVVDTTPDEHGEYTLRIETFATGEVTLTKKSTPSDIVLVLDASGSMAYECPQSSLTFAQQAVAQTTNYCYNAPVNYGNNYHRYYKLDDNYYQVNRGTVKVPNPAYDPENPDAAPATVNSNVLYFTANGTRYYLYGNSTDENGGLYPNNVPSDYPVISAQNAKIWNGTLYRYKTRQEVLKEAAIDFVDKIAQNDAEEVQPYLSPGKKGNQISVVQFTGNYTVDSNIYSDLSEKPNSTSASPYVRKAFTTVDNATNITNIKNAINKLPASGNTPHDAGMKLARLLLENLEATDPAIDPVYGTKARNKTVVFFTDGNPEVSNVSVCQVTYHATDEAYTIKNDLHGQVFSIGFNTSANTRKFLQYASSLYKDGRQNTTTGAWAAANYTGTLNDDGIPYFMEAGANGTDLSEVFDIISEYAGGGNTEYGNTSLMAIDLVSQDFVLPENVDVSRVKIYTVPCVGTTGETITDDKGNTHPQLAFATLDKDKVLSPNRGPIGNIWVRVPEVDEHGDPVLDDDDKPVYVWENKTNWDIDGTEDEPLVVNVDVANNSVSVRGFDYGKLWCGIDEEHENSEEFDKNDYPDTYVEGYRGFKLVIEFPILVKDGAIGGPDVLTNRAGSGLYQTDADGNKVGEPIVEYPKPALPIPVNLWIEKRGLKEGESANFTILRKLVHKESESDPDPEYENFTKLLITGAPGDVPVVVKLLNLDPRYFYKIKEEGWSWSYTNQAQDLETAPSTETITANPIVIENSYNDPDIKHAEAVKRNEMSEY